jgi:hypothetical protein
MTTKAVTYTPGPWKVATNPFWVVTDAKGYHPNIAKMGDDGITSQANARLIAAAPDLLEALEECDQAFTSWQVGQIPGRPEDILGLVHHVRNAIARARGEAGEVRHG